MTESHDSLRFIDNPDATIPCSGCGNFEHHRLIDYLGMGTTFLCEDCEYQQTLDEEG